MIMTLTNKNPYYGVPPAPITKMTMEQEFKMRQIEDALNHPSTRKEDIITVFVALQEQAFILGNNIANLVKQWPTHPNTTQEDQ